MAQKKRKKKPAPRKGLSSRSKWIILGVLGGIIVIGGGGWGYYELTTIPPPDLTDSNSDEVVHFLGSRRGFRRLSIDDRQAFMLRTVKYYHQGEPRRQFAESLGRMSSGERQVLIDSVVDVSKVRAMEKAQKFNKISNKSRRQRKNFIDDAIRDFEGLRHPIRGEPTSGGTAGSGAPPPSLFGVFKADMPRGSDELMKVVVSRTSARERAKLTPFANAVASRYKELKNSGELERLLAGARR